MCRKSLPIMSRDVTCCCFGFQLPLNMAQKAHARSDSSVRNIPKFSLEKRPNLCLDEHIFFFFLISKDGTSAGCFPASLSFRQSVL